MVHEATKQIQAAFSKENLKFNTEEKDDTSWVSISIGTDEFNLDVWFLSSDEDTDVCVRVVPFVKGREEKHSALVDTCNELNNRFRYIKFIVDKDSDVCMEADFPVTLPMDEVGAVALEYVSRFLSISKKAYPDLMKTLWA